MLKLDEVWRLLVTQLATRDAAAAAAYNAHTPRYILEVNVNMYVGN